MQKVTPTADSLWQCRW